MNQETKEWKPLRPSEAEINAIADDVDEVNAIQKRICTHHPKMNCPDRVAHQYQIAGSKVLLDINDTLPDELMHVGLFKPNAQYIGIGRLSTGLGTPHVESLPDFLGIMTAFQTDVGRRVDLLGINDSTAPADNHRHFVDVLHATGEAAGEDIPLIGEWGDYDLGNFLAEQKTFGIALIKRQGMVQAGKSITHIIKQTLRTFHSSSAYQTYWTGIVEAKHTAGKFMFMPLIDDNPKPGILPGETHLSDDWRLRQQTADIVFDLYWIPFIDQAKTSTTHMTREWNETGKSPVAKITFPKTDFNSEEALCWRILAAEMGANPGNWIADEGNTIEQPATEFTLARKLAYQISQQGRGVLPEHFYHDVFNTGEISAQLKQELLRRLNEKSPKLHKRWAE